MDYMIYSDSLDCMVVIGFMYCGQLYTWNDSDCIYWNDEIDGDGFMEVPFGAKY